MTYTHFIVLFATENKKHYQGFKMTEIELGVKRRCISCGIKFYDFLRAPIICPNCNTEFDPEHIDELMRSIQEKGVIQPITVNRVGQSYHLIAGERRWRATRRTRPSR